MFPLFYPKAANYSATSYYDFMKQGSSSKLEILPYFATKVQKSEGKFRNKDEMINA